MSKYRNAVFYDYQSRFLVIFSSNYRHRLVLKISFPDHIFFKISKYPTENLHFPSTSKYQLRGAGGGVPAKVTGTVTAGCCYRISVSRIMTSYYFFVVFFTYLSSQHITGSHLFFPLYKQAFNFSVITRRVFRSSPE